MAKARIGNSVKNLREANGVTQSDLAAHCGCTRQTIIMLEQKKYVPSLSLAFAIAAALGAGVEDIFEPEVKTTKLEK
jgi:putative transcriptional regulator